MLPWPSAGKCLGVRLRCCSQHFSKLDRPAPVSRRSCSPKLHGDGLDWWGSWACCGSIPCRRLCGACCIRSWRYSHGFGSCCSCRRDVPCRQLQQCLFFFLQLSSELKICMHKSVCKAFETALAALDQTDMHTRALEESKPHTTKTSTTLKPHLCPALHHRSTLLPQPPQQALAAPRAQAGGAPRAAATPPALHQSAAAGRPHTYTEARGRVPGVQKLCKGA